MKERSPFTPGHPVPLEYFVGRQKEIDLLRRAIEQVALGKNENIFLTGERGIGKSSLASLCKAYAVENYQLVGAHCYLSGIKGVPDFCRTILQRLLDENPESSFLDKARALIGRYVEELKFEIPFIGLKTGLRLKKELGEIEDLPLNFPSIVENLYQTIKDKHKGFAIILDDLNGLTKVQGVSLFIKSFIDDLAGSIPLFFCLVGVEERMGDLATEQPSVTRIFHPIELGPMSNKECVDFYKKAFSSVSISFEDVALQTMTEYSGGLPTLLHEIGEATFYVDTDNKIDINDALRGVIDASKVVGKKYIDRQVFEEIRSDARRKLLLKIVKSEGRGPEVGVRMEKGGGVSLMETLLIERKKVLQVLVEEEKKDFDNLLRRMTRLGILNKSDERGKYTFQNRLFPVYIRMFLAEKIEKKRLRG